MKKQRYTAIEVFRLVAAVLVITVHTSPLLSVSETADLFLAQILARVAVPFFIITTGFFVFSRNRAEPFSYRKFLLKMGSVYGLSLLLYLPLNIHAGHFAGGDSLLTVTKAILVDGTFYHLWYFPALMLGMGLTVLLLKCLAFRTAMAVAGLLYLFGLLGDSYYGISTQIPFVQSSYDILFHFSSYTRNGLFYVPVFLLLGAWMSRRLPRYPFRVNVMCLLVSLLLLLTEGWWLHSFSQPRHDSMYVFLLPSVFFLFQILLSHKEGGFLRLGTMAMFVYILHPWCIVVAMGLAKVAGAQAPFVENSLVHFAVVTLMSIAVAVPLGLLWDKTRLPWDGRKQPPTSARRAWAEINLSNLEHNLRQLQSVLPKGCRVMAVVKADAYGHGAVRVASELRKMGVDSFAVATLGEGVQLRENGIRGDILILGYTGPEAIPELRRYRLTQTVVDYAHAEALNHHGQQLPVHIKIDTGMRRSGEYFDHKDKIVEMLRFPNLIVQGLFSHLCVADSQLPKDKAFTRQQIANFQSVTEMLKAGDCCPPELHIQSSYGALNYPEIRGCSAARIGIALYGALSDERDQTRVKIDLRPVLSIRAVVAVVKEIAAWQTVGYDRQFQAVSPMKVATVAIGYADGIPRNLAGGNVLIRGQKAPIIGRISMDQLTVDVTSIPDVRQGDVATVIGEDGEQRILVEQVAGQCGTITNEILSRLGSRLERVYVVQQWCNGPCQLALAVIPYN